VSESQHKGSDHTPQKSVGGRQKKGWGQFGGFVCSLLCYSALGGLTMLVGWQEAGSMS